MSGIFGAAADVDYEAEMSMNQGRWQPTIRERAWDPTISEEGATQQWAVPPTSANQTIAAPVVNPTLAVAAPSRSVAPSGSNSAAPAGTQKKPSAYDQVVPYVKGTVAMAAIVHGYKRNKDSVLWGLAWGAMGYSVWWLAAPLMVAQGFSKPAAK